METNVHEKSPQKAKKKNWKKKLTFMDLNLGACEPSTAVHLQNINVALATAILV